MLFTCFASTLKSVYPVSTYLCELVWFYDKLLYKYNDFYMFGFIADFTNKYAITYLLLADISTKELKLHFSEYLYDIVFYGCT